MFVLIRALIAAVIIFGIWKLVFYIMSTYQDKTSCPSCDGNGWYLSVREREKCKVCEGTGERMQDSRK